MYLFTHAQHAPGDLTFTVVKAWFSGTFVDAVVFPAFYGISYVCDITTMSKGTGCYRSELQSLRADQFILFSVWGCQIWDGTPTRVCPCSCVYAMISCN